MRTTINPETGELDLLGFVGDGSDPPIMGPLVLIGPFSIIDKSNSNTNFEVGDSTTIGFQVNTLNNTLDDGSGNVIINGHLDTAHNTLDNGSGDMFINGQETLVFPDGSTLFLGLRNGSNPGFVLTDFSTGNFAFFDIIPGGATEFVTSTDTFYIGTNNNVNLVVDSNGNTYFLNALIADNFSYPAAGIPSIDPNGRILYDSTVGPHAALDWNNRNAVALPAYTSNGFLKTSSSNGTLTVDTTTYATASTTPSIVGTDRKTALTAAQALATYTVPASDTTFIVSANILITASTLHSFSVTCSYTDESNTARVLTLNFSQLTGAFVTTLTNALGASAYEGVPVHIRCKASTTIIIASTGTFTTVTYNLEERIVKQ